MFLQALCAFSFLRVLLTLICLRALCAFIFLRTLHFIYVYANITDTN